MPHKRIYISPSIIYLEYDREEMIATSDLKNKQSVTTGTTSITKFSGEFDSNIRSGLIEEGLEDDW